MLTTVEKWVALTFGVVALGLILTHPSGTTQAGSAITNFYTSSVKQLQSPGTGGG